MPCLALPGWLPEVEPRNLRGGDAAVDLRVRVREVDGGATWGELEVRSG